LLGCDMISDRSRPEAVKVRTAQLAKRHCNFCANITAHSFVVVVVVIVIVISTLPTQQQ